jgi:RNA polymerase sigma-70 factor (ECF subfamily)
MLTVMEQLSDEQLLAAGGSLEFALFYRRHAEAVLAYFARRVHHAEAAADLTAETFAAAVVARERFRPERGPAAAWLYGIAAHKLFDYQRRGRLEDRARRRLGMTRRAVSADDVVEIEALSAQVVAEMLAPLPADQREAVAAHVIDDASYDELARSAGVTTSAIRHRVSRGLRTLRNQLDQERR